ncbi:twin transmembrane helix small protein [Pseudomonas shirazica]|nr:twin transmembrane helix small protein [Pseudomonas shirazica]
MLKAAIVLMLLATIASLFSGLVFLVKDDENSTRLLKALTVRVTLAALTIGLVAWGFISGQLVSHTPSEVFT